jgi:hypothetical protein
LQLTAFSFNFNPLRGQHTRWPLSNR